MRKLGKVRPRLSVEREVRVYRYTRKTSAPSKMVHRKVSTKSLRVNGHRCCVLASGHTACSKKMRRRYDFLLVLLDDLYTIPTRKAPKNLKVPEGAEFPYSRYKNGKGLAQLRNRRAA